MMLSPQHYYAENLQSKTADEIRAVIRSLKRKIRRLQKVVANPGEYPEEWGICPNPVVQLGMYRQYLQEATTSLMNTIEYLG